MSIMDDAHREQSFSNVNKSRTEYRIVKGGVNQLRGTISHFHFFQFCSCRKWLEGFLRTQRRVLWPFNSCHLESYALPSKSVFTLNNITQYIDKCLFCVAALEYRSARFPNWADLLWTDLLRKLLEMQLQNWFCSPNGVFGSLLQTADGRVHRKDN